MHYLDKDNYLSVIYKPIASLKPNPKNPRSHSNRQIKQIAASIRSFGFITPLLIDNNLTILAGHGRVLAAQALGIQEVPTINHVG